MFSVKFGFTLDCTASLFVKGVLMSVHISNRQMNAKGEYGHATPMSLPDLFSLKKSCRIIPAEF